MSRKYEKSGTKLSTCHIIDKKSFSLSMKSFFCTECEWGYINSDSIVISKIYHHHHHHCHIHLHEHLLNCPHGTTSSSWLHRPQLLSRGRRSPPLQKNIRSAYLHTQYTCKFWLKCIFSCLKQDHKRWISTVDKLQVVLQMDRLMANG